MKNLKIEIFQKKVLDLRINRCRLKIDRCFQESTFKKIRNFNFKQKLVMSQEFKFFRTFVVPESSRTSTSKICASRSISRAACNYSIYFKLNSHNKFLDYKIRTKMGGLAALEDLLRWEDLLRQGDLRIYHVISVSGATCYGFLGGGFLLRPGYRTDKSLFPPNLKIRTPDVEL